ncbi:hypothetical protein GOV06_00815 [Candidatus Woesearchaeota archaeon]|nr:hypothetical protein [Candidatus Woesearchaeota archaeon]
MEEIIEFMKKYDAIVESYSKELGIPKDKLMEDFNRWAFTDSFPFALDIGNRLGLNNQPLDKEAVLNCDEFRQALDNFFFQGIAFLKGQDEIKLREKITEQLYEIVDYGYQVGKSGKELTHDYVSHELHIYQSRGLEGILR